MRRATVVCAAITLATQGFGCAVRCEDAGPLSFPKWKPISTEYTRVQSGDWIDNDRFVVGRWDGSISVFAKPESGALDTPRLIDVRRTDHGEGVELIKALEDGYIVSSNGNAKLTVWTPEAPTSGATTTYDTRYGAANSADEARFDDQDLLLTGHQEGYLLVWSYRTGNLGLQSVIDLNSPNPVPSPYPLKNIRGIAKWAGTKVVAGSEDGDLTMIDLSTGKVIFRQRYNPSAQRGINSISISGDFLLVSNCSVGQADKNLWLFRIESSKFVPLDSINLLDNQSRPRSFDFDADLANIDDTLRFFASTEEGFVWTGTIEDDRLKIFRTAFVASEGGALLDVSPNGSTLLAASDKIFLFDAIPASE